MSKGKKTDTQLSRKKALHADGMTAGAFLLGGVNNPLADMNMHSDGQWNYTWDAENRLTSMTDNTNVGPQLQLVFAMTSAEIAAVAFCVLGTVYSAIKGGKTRWMILLYCGFGALYFF